MARFRPWVGEKDMYPVQAFGWEGALQHLHHVMLDNTYVRQSEFFDLLEQAAYPRGMNFDGEIIILGMRLGDGRGRFAHAKTYFQESGRASAEDMIKIKQVFRRRSGKWNAVFRHEHFMGAALSI